MKYTLRGKVARSHPYSLDKTLTVEGTAAESKSTGEAIEKVRKTLSEELSKHTSSTNNPHKVTKAQVGLGEVDNTSDENKPVSIAQAEAIKKAKEDAVSVANNAQTSADNAKKAADDAKKAADDAQTTADSKCAVKTATVTLVVTDWAENKQTVAVEGVVEDVEKCHVIVSPAEESRESYNYEVVRCTAQGEGTLTFACDSVPESDLTVCVLILV